MRRLNIKPIILLLTLVSSLFTSCKKEAEVSPDIIGKWKAQANQYRIVYEANGNQYDKTGTRATQSTTTVEFKADGTLSGLPYPYTYTLTGDQLTLRYGTSVETGKVILVGSQLTLTGSENLIAGLSETDKIKEAKGWASEINYSNGGDGEFTNLSKATKAIEVYATTVYERVK